MRKFLMGAAALALVAALPQIALAADVALQERLLGLSLEAHQ